MSQQALGHLSPNPIQIPESGKSRGEPNWEDSTDLSEYEQPASGGSLFLLAIHSFLTIYSDLHSIEFTRVLWR
jgi:hypothetical protein